MIIMIIVIIVVIVLIAVIVVVMIVISTAAPSSGRAALPPRARRRAAGRPPWALRHYICMYIYIYIYIYVYRERERCLAGLSPRLADLREMLRSFRFRGFPVVDGHHFVGYSRRGKLEDFILKWQAEEGKEQDVVCLADLIPYTDTSVMRMVPDAPLQQAHQVFKQLGCQHIFIVGSADDTSGEVLKGILSKKSFLQFLQDGRVGHMPVPARQVSPAHPTSPKAGQKAGQGPGGSPGASGLRFAFSQSHRSSASAKNAVKGELFSVLEAAALAGQRRGEQDDSGLRRGSKTAP